MIPLDPAPRATREKLCDPAAPSGRVAREMARSASILPIGCGLFPSDSRDRQALLLQRAQSSSSGGRSVRVTKFRVG